MKALMRHMRWTGFAAMFAFSAAAQPSLALSERFGDIRVFRDLKQSNVYYYEPFDFQLVRDSRGKPDFSLVQMRYTGTRATADAGEIKFLNLLQFRVNLDPGQVLKVNELRNELKKRVAAPDLRPLPVRKFSSVLVFAGIGEPAFADDSLLMVRAASDPTGEDAEAGQSYWTDRTITMRLSNEEAQLVESALRNRSTAMSFSYAIYTAFSETAPGEFEIGGKGALQKKIRDHFRDEIRNARDSLLHITLVKADAINLYADPEQWPLIQKVDINEKMPAKYPLFDVYCYDFNNELRADLVAKRIEIRATSVNGAEVTNRFTFRALQPEVYSRSVRFPYAIRFDRPFYYRVTEITAAGEIEVGQWKEKTEWSELLDITSPPEKIVKPTTIENDPTH